MAYNFPSSPTLNQLYTYQGYTWSWNGQYWRIQAPQAVTGATGATGIGATGATGPAGAPGTPGTPGSGGGGAANVTVRDEGTVLTTAVSSINFVGAGVSSSASGDAVTVTISGGGGGGGSTLTFGNTAPANPQVGDRWINSEDLIELVYVNDGDNSFWLEPAGGSGGGGGGGGNFTYGNTAPVAPAIGDRWMDSDNLKEFVYIYDGDSYAWVEPSIDAGLVGATGATGPQGATGAGATGATGPTGLGFTIAKSYASVALLLADTAPTGIVAGQFGIVETGNVENAENSRLYLWSGTAWSYVTDLSGAQGITGPQGATGTAGTAGATGATGAVGATGTAGAAGATGATGTQGNVGPVGATGIQGNVGPAGATGPAGTSANISVYDEGSLVTGTVTGLNFVGAGITANTVSGNVQITVTATGTGSGGGFQYANTAPASPQTGDRWLDSDSMIEYVYVNDGDSSQWVEPITRAFSTNLTSVSTHVIPDSNVSYDLGTSSLRWRDLYLSGNSIILGAATLSSTGSAVNLPAGSTVGGQNIPSSGDVATGGGPKITNVQVTNSSWTVIDDTAVDTTGGYVKITGTNFVSGCQVVAGTTTASAVSFVSSTELRVQFGAIAAGTYILYVSNPDGGVALRVNGITFSASPSWQTGSSLGEIYDGVVINLGLVATEATSYAVTAGSLPPGLSLNANTGVITGTVTGVTVDTTYNFTVTATDPQNQDSPRAFSITVSVSDPYFKLTTLLLSGSAISANTVIRDSSTNNFNLTVSGDARASNFTPYGTGWSVYFDGSGDSLDFATNAAFTMGTGDFTIELWYFCNVSYASGNGYLFDFGSNGTRAQLYFNQLYFIPVAGSSLSMSAGVGMAVGVWYHLACVRFGSVVTVYLNGTSIVSNTNTGNLTDNDCRIGDYGGGGNGFNGFISNFRVVKGTAVYTANFTPATTNLTSVANTSLLTCHANRFLDGSTNNFTITRNGDARVVSFNPFGITNTGVNGSMYFDGTGDYVSIADNINLNFGTSDFIVSFWIYPTAFNTQNCVIGKGSSNFVCSFPSNGTIQIAQYDIAVRVSSSIPLLLNQWAYVVGSRVGTTTKIFLNGVETGSATDSSNYTSATVLQIGQDPSNSSQKLTGYLADVRIVKGSGTTSVTVPTQPLTAITNTQLLTLQYDQPHNNHTFLDSSSNQFLITRNGNATQGTFSPFSQSGHSAYFDGTGDYLSIPTNTAFDLPGDFTIEYWVYVVPLAGNSNYHIITRGYYQSGAQDWIVAIGADYNAFMGWGTTVTGHSAGFITPNTWFHIAFARSGTTLRAFKNGVLSNSITTSVNLTNTQAVTIGTNSANSANNLMSGYISNLRIIKGTALYTTTFTPSTTPLTSVANTSLLACHANRFIDGSANNFTVTRNGDTRITAFGPFSTTVYSPTSNGGSVYLDGTGDYLNTGSDVGFNLGVGNFTWEFWTYLTASPADGNILFQPRTPAGIDAVLFGYKSGSNFTIYATTDGGGSWNLFSNTVIIAVADVLNRWAHWAFIRNGSTYTVYVDGISKVSGTSASQISQATNVFTLGAVVSGYFSGFRFVKAQALSTGNFTPPTAPLAANTIGWTGANVATSLTGTVNFLLNFTDAAILDSTGRTVIETVADAKTSSVVTKFTGGSMSFDGTGDWLEVKNKDNQAFNFGSGDFTIEGWYNVPNASTQYALVGRGPSDADDELLILLNNGTYYIDWGGYMQGGSYTANAWHHFALVRIGTDFRLYHNGTSVVSATLTAGYSFTNNYTLKIGSGRGGSYVFNGYINDIRITRGYARYTANFTPPTGPARLK